MIILTADCSRKYFASASLKRKFVLFLYIEGVLLKLMLMKKEALNDMSVVVVVVDDDDVLLVGLTLGQS